MLQLDTDIDVARGAVLSAPDAAPTAARRLETHLVWLADQPLDSSHGLLLRTATDLVPVSAIAIRAAIDLETLGTREVATCQTNDIVIAEITLGRSAALDIFTRHRETGSFILVDALTGATLAGGIIATAAAGSGSVGRDVFHLTRAMLSTGVCAGLDVADPEFRRRAAEVAIILRAAGVTVDIEEG